MDLMDFNVCLTSHLLNVVLAVDIFRLGNNAANADRYHCR